MRRQYFLKSIVSVSIVIASSLILTHRLSSLAAGARTERQADDSKAPKDKDTHDRMQAALANQDPDTLIVGDDKGEITAKYNTNKLRKEGYKSLSDFVERDGSKECKKISSKCRKCPNGKVYCTNDARFAADERMAQHP